MSGKHSVSSKCVVNMDGFGGFGKLFQKVEIKSCGSLLNPETLSLLTACLMVLWSAGIIQHQIIGYLVDKKL